jgi:hypothetical protein
MPKANCNLILPQHKAVGALGTKTSLILSYQAPSCHRLLSWRHCSCLTHSSTPTYARHRLEPSMLAINNLSNRGSVGAALATPAHQSCNGVAPPSRARGHRTRRCSLPWCWRDGLDWTGPARLGWLGVLLAGTSSWNLLRYLPGCPTLVRWQQRPGPGTGADWWLGIGSWAGLQVLVRLARAQPRWTAFSSWCAGPGLTGLVSLPAMVSRDRWRRPNCSRWCRAALATWRSRVEPSLARCRAFLRARRSSASLMTTRVELILGDHWLQVAMDALHGPIRPGLPQAIVATRLSFNLRQKLLVLLLTTTALLRAKTARLPARTRDRKLPSMGKFRVKHPEPRLSPG